MNGKRYPEMNVNQGEGNSGDVGRNPVRIIERMQTRQKMAMNVSMLLF
jgi:hypothetical protein